MSDMRYGFGHVENFDIDKTVISPYKPKKAEVSLSQSRPINHLLPPTNTLLRESGMSIKIKGSGAKWEKFFVK